MTTLESAAAAMLKPCHTTDGEHYRMGSLQGIPTAPCDHYRALEQVLDKEVEWPVDITAPAP